MSAIPTITIWQPWASWIAAGLKTIETRTHTRFRNLVGKTIAIHAGCAFDKEAFFEAGKFIHLPTSLPRPTHYDYGKVIALAQVKEFRKLDAFDSSWALFDCEKTKRYGLFFANIYPLGKPVRAKGHQGIWHWAPSVEAISLLSAEIKK